MKNKALHIIICILAIYIAYIGGGINIYKYCCDTCKSYGHEMFNSVYCCEVHEKSWNEHSGSAMHQSSCKDEDGSLHCSMMHSGNHCDIRHIEAPVLQNFSIESIDFSSPLVAILTIFISEDDIQPSTLCANRSASCFWLPKGDGRDIITSKSSYLI